MSLVYESIQDCASAVGATAPTNHSANPHKEMNNSMQERILNKLAKEIKKDQQTFCANSCILNASSATVVANKTPASAQYGSINNISSTETAAACSRSGTAVQSSASTDRHVTEQITSPIPPHVNQSTENYFPAVGATAPTNQSASQPQGNIQVFATCSSHYSGRSNHKGPTYVDMGGITINPKKLEDELKDTYLDSFKDWPRDHPLRKEDLAAAGFYYLGYSDCIRCFCCGGRLENWDADTDVWVEHARWFPQCTHVQATMGQQFVETVQDLKNSCDKITFTMVEEKMKSSTLFQQDNRNMSLERVPAVLAMVAMGYREEDIIAAVNYVREKYGMLSSPMILERLDNVEEASITKQKNEEEMKKLEEENALLRQQKACKICLVNEVEQVFLPCGHFVSCTYCAADLAVINNECPICRRSIERIERIFMS